MSQKFAMFILDLRYFTFKLRVNWRRLWRANWKQQSPNPKEYILFCQHHLEILNGCIRPTMAWPLSTVRKEEISKEKIYLAHGHNISNAPCALCLTVCTQEWRLLTPKMFFKFKDRISQIICQKIQTDGVGTLRAGQPALVRLWRGTTTERLLSATSRLKLTRGRA